MRSRAVFAVAAALACSDPVQTPFKMPKNIDDARGRLLVRIPEGRDIAGARQWMAEHGYVCEPAMPSATDAHAHLCHAQPSTPADAGWRAWTVTLVERRGRLADLQVR